MKNNKEMEKENAIIINGVRYDLIDGGKYATCDDCALEYNCSNCKDWICVLFTNGVDCSNMIFKEIKTENK